MTPTLRVVRGFKVAYPAFLEEAYAKQLLALAARLKLLTFKHLSLKSANPESALNSSMRQDDIIDDLEDLIKSINAAISFEVVKVINTLSQRFVAVRKFVDHSFRQSLSHIATANYSLRAAGTPLKVAAGTTDIDIELLKKMWVEKNTQLIRDIPADSLAGISDAVYEAVRRGESMQSLAGRLNGIFQFTERKAKIIARDQIAKLKGEISRYNDLTHGLTTYEWSSCKDGAVRDSHRVLDGKICSWADSTIYKNKIGEEWKKRSSIGGIQKHVGEDIMCRCTNIILQEVEVGS